MSFLPASCSFFNHSESGQTDEKTSAQSNDGENQEIHNLTSELESLKNQQDGLKKELEKKDQGIEMLQDRIKTLEAKIHYLTTQDTKNLNPPDLYNKARELMQTADYLVAADLFNDFIKKYPEHDLADNSYYWLGECHYTLSKYEQAISVFKELLKKYPGSNKVPAALLKTGYAYISLDDSNRAHHYIKKVVLEYPFSPEAEKAQEKLKSFE